MALFDAGNICSVNTTAKSQLFLRDAFFLSNFYDTVAKPVVKKVTAHFLALYELYKPYKLYNFINFINYVVYRL